MLIHASCAARAGCGLLLTGSSGSGKSDLLLRLLDRGFDLVADDQVDVVDGTASPPASLEGLIEIRGLGLIRLPFVARARLVLAVVLGRTERLPTPCRDAHGLPLVHVDPAQHSAPQRVALAFDCAMGRTTCVTGAFSL